MDIHHLISQILDLTSPVLTKEEKELLESAPQGEILDSQSFVMAMIAAERRKKATESLRQLLN
ncbi:MAG: hypothetical protein WC244_02120 [Patescibacteria group bacterium]|jgi:hypothetical protein